MAVGRALSKTEIDARAGDIAVSFQRTFDETAKFQSFLEATPNADLEAVGYTPDDVATLKTAYADAARLGRVFIGAEAQPAPYDYRTFLRRLWGVGSF